MQRKVVEFAHSLTGSIPSGTPGNQLLRFAGTMTEAEAKEMMDAIEDCERVDPNEW
jgi:L-rhamnose isomerase